MTELVTFLVANGDSASGRPPRHTINALRLGLSYRPTVVLACELRNLTDMPTRLHGYGWHREGTPGSPESAVAIGWDRAAAGPLEEPRLRLGSRATREGRHVTGRGIDDRWMLGGRIVVWGGRPGVAVFHAAPNRAPIARALGLARFARFRAAFKGGDLNLPQRAAARALGRKVAGGGLLWLSIPRGWEHVSTQLLDVGAEHQWPLVTVRKRPPRRSRR